jgi:hypothetical protein
MGPSPTGPPSAYIIPGNPSTFYDKPIAILVGPGALSSGDQVALRMKFHPKAKFFGKSTTAAFNAPTSLDLGNSDWSCRYAEADAYLVSNPNHYLTHDELTVDEEVWLTPDDVAQGYDTVVRTAIAWIDSHYMDLDRFTVPWIASFFELYQNYPNPFNPITTIEFVLPKTSEVTLKIFNILGEEVATLVYDKLHPGSYSYEWDASNVASGVYLYRLQAGDYVKTRKMVLIR